MKRLAFGAVAALAAVAFAQEGDKDLPQVPAADAKVLEKLNQVGGIAMALASNTNLVTVDLHLVGDKIGDAELSLLKPIAEQLFWLNLANTKVTDAGLGEIASLKNIQRLHLEKTSITDPGLEHVAKLQELRYLNLYGTKVTDKGLASLKGLKKLEKLFVWQTAVTEAGASELAKALPSVKIDRGWEAEAPPPAKPINAKCPLTGKDLNPDAVVTYKGQAIAFCCMNCKGKFEKDPEKYIAQVKEFKEPKKPVNAKCPVSGKDVDPAFTAPYKDAVIAFCCDKCKAKFEKDPDKIAANVKELAKPAAPAPKPAEPAANSGKPVNAKCPLTGKDIDPQAVSVYKGQTVAFCCMKCKAKFDKNPDKYAGKIKADAPAPAAPAKPINAKCPISGEDAKAKFTFTYKNQVIGFCCENCQAKFSKDPEKYLGQVKEFKQ